MGIFSKIKGIISSRDLTPDSAQEVKDWQKNILEALNTAEADIPTWIDIALPAGVEVGPGLWERLTFFLNCLSMPEEQRKSFLSLFKDWVETAKPASLAEIKAALGHRLALALELDESNACREDLRCRLRNSLAKTREQLATHVDSMLNHTTLDQSFWDDLTETFILADVGHKTSASFADRLKKRAHKSGVSTPKQLKEHLFAEMDDIFSSLEQKNQPEPPEVILMVGVNGVGKTTTVAKLAHRFKMQGKKVLIAAADTFRAAAIEQLQIWAERTGVGFHAKTQSSDPAAVAYEAVDKGIRENYDLVIIDTAGRLHTKANLMEELAKIKRVIAKRHPGSPHHTVLVLDATTGQNALSQVTFFQEAVGVNEVILTKLDGTAKGGVVLAVAMQFNLPVSFIGMGEKMEDLRPFEGRDFAEALLGI